MERATVVKLSPKEGATEGSTDTVVSFEEAFGEHSNFLWFFGAKARLRRAKRRARRRARRAARQHEKEVADAEASMYNQQTGQEGLGDVQSDAAAKYAQEGGAPAPTDGAGAPQDASAPQAPTDGGAPQYAPQGGAEEPVPSEAQQMGDGGAPQEDSEGFDGSGTKSIEEYEAEDFSGFAGEDLSRARYNTADGSGVVPAQVTRLVAEIARLKASAKRHVLEASRLNSMLRNSSPEEAAYISKNRAMHLDRANVATQKGRELQEVLYSYHSPQGQEDEIRAMQVNGAMRHVMGLAERKRRMRANRGGSETPTNRDFVDAPRGTAVESNLKPQFSNQRIEIPAERTAGFDGSETPRATLVEMQSSATGDKKKGAINWTYVAIGAGLAVAGIIAYRKFSKK